MKYNAVIKKELLELIRLKVIKKTDSTVVYQKFNNVYQAGLSEGRKCSTQNHRSPVALYDKQMRFIKRWRTVIACVNETGFSETYIHFSARTKLLTSKGYFIKVKKTKQKHKSPTNFKA